MHKQFFGKETKFVLLGALCVYLAAALAWWQPILALPLIIIALGAMAYVTFRHVPTAFGIVLAELIIGGHGLLIHADAVVSTITLRHAVFIGFFLGYALRVIMKKEVLRRFSAVGALSALAIWLSVSFLIGGIDNGWHASFDEFNSYFYLLFFIPVLARIWTHAEKRRVLVIAFGALMYLALMTIVFAYAYDHIPGKVMNIPYKIYRDAGVTEISLQVIQNPPAGFIQEQMAPLLGVFPYWYRIFSPSHVFFLVGILMYVAYGLLHGIDRSIRKHWATIVSVLLFALFLGMSRSILLALVVSGFVMICTVLAMGLARKTSFSFATVGWGSISALIAVLGFVIVAAIAIPARPDLRDATFYATSAGTTRSAAVVSRWSLLEKLNEGISEAPLFGHGLGRTVTYTSSDPRVIEETGGEYNTYRFEWGYHDFLLKMGAFGVLLYLYFLWALFGTALIRLRTRPWLELGALASVLALCITHVFSPYLNHPLGIGILLLAALLVCTPSEQAEPIKLKEKNVLMTFSSRVSAISTQENLG
jgi:hypothetical protein